MDFNKIVANIDQLISEFSFGTLEDKATNPFLFVVRVSSEGVIGSETMARYIAKAQSNIHHQHRPQDCLAIAFKLCSGVISKIPFEKEIQIKEKCTHGQGFKLKSGEYIILISIASSYNDAEWVASRFKTLFV